MKLTTALAAAGLSLAAFLSASPAMALNTRSFVSPTGNDANACTLPAPCRTFQIAFNQTIAGGEIDVLGSAGYGALTIDKAISIVNPGGYVASMFVAAGGVGITVNAPADAAVNLQGLTIDGGGAGYNGIVFNSGASLTIDNCVVKNFHNIGDAATGHGIYIAPTSGTLKFAITNTTASNNGYGGVSMFMPIGGSANITGVIDHLVATANQFYGIVSDSHSSGAETVAIANSITSDAYSGIFSGNYGSGTMKVSIDNVTASGNQRGIEADGTAKVFLGRSTIMGNTEFGTYNSTSPNTFYTFQNNQVYLNATDVGGTAPTPVSFH